MAPAAHGSRRDGLALGAITLLAAALRGWRLDLQSLWNDELASWHVAHWPTLAGVLERGVVPDVHPPGYFLLLHLWMRLAGSSEVALRAPSVLFGVLAVPAAYGLGRCLYTRREGLLAAAVTATAWMPVYYSREARPYALLILCAILSTWWLVETVRGLEGTGRLPLLAGAYALATTLGAYTHYFGLLFIGVQAVAASLRLLRRPRLVPALGAVYGAILVAYVPWIPHLLEDMRLESFWIPPPEAGALLDLYRYQLGRWDALAVLVALLLAAAWTRWILLDTCGQPLAVRLRRSLASPAALLAAWLLAPPIIVWVRSRLAAPVFTLRNLVLTAPALYQLMARSLTRLAPQGRAGALAAALLCGLLLFDLGPRRRFYSAVTKEQWREAVDSVLDAAAPLPAMPVFAAALHPDYFEYYFQRNGAPRQVRLLVSGRHIDSLERELRRTGATHFWYLQAHRNPARSLRRHLESRHRLVHQEDLLGATVRLYAVGPDPEL